MSASSTSPVGIPPATPQEAAREAYFELYDLSQRKDWQTCPLPPKIGEAVAHALTYNDGSGGPKLTKSVARWVAAQLFIRGSLDLIQKSTQEEISKTEPGQWTLLDCCVYYCMQSLVPVDVQKWVEHFGYDPVATALQNPTDRPNAKSQAILKRALIDVAKLKVQQQLNRRSK